MQAICEIISYAVLRQTKGWIVTGAFNMPYSPFDMYLNASSAFSLLNIVDGNGWTSPEAMPASMWACSSSIYTKHVFSRLASYICAIVEHKSWVKICTDRYFGLYDWEPAIANLCRRDCKPRQAAEFSKFIRLSGHTSNVSSGSLNTLSRSMPSYAMLRRSGLIESAVPLRMSYFPISNSLPRLPRHLTLA